MIFGIIISVAGLSLAFLGVQVLTAAFGLLTGLLFTYMLVVILTLMFKVNLAQPLGIVVTVISMIIALPIGKKAMKIADMYAISFFAALLASSLMGFAVKLADLSDRLYVREIIEVVGFLTGFYFGKKYRHQIKVLITALLGANLCVYGASLALKWQPLSPQKSPGLFTTYSVLNLVLFVVSYAYQKYQIKKLNARIASQNSSTLLYDGLSEDERRN